MLYEWYLPVDLDSPDPSIIGDSYVQYTTSRVEECTYISCHHLHPDLLDHLEFMGGILEELHQLIHEVVAWRCMMLTYKFVVIGIYLSITHVLEELLIDLEGLTMLILDERFGGGMIRIGGRYDLMITYRIHRLVDQ